MQASLRHPWLQIDITTTNRHIRRGFGWYSRNSRDFQPKPSVLAMYSKVKFQNCFVGFQRQIFASAQTNSKQMDICTHFSKPSKQIHDTLLTTQLKLLYNTLTAIPKWATDYHNPQDTEMKGIDKYIYINKAWLSQKQKQKNLLVIKSNKQLEYK